MGVPEAAAPVASAADAPAKPVAATPRTPERRSLANTAALLAAILLGSVGGGFGLGQFPAVRQSAASLLGVSGAESTKPVATARAPRPAPRRAPPPITLELVQARTLDLEAGQYESFRFYLPAERICTVTGTMTGLAGGNRDVDVFIVDDDGLASFENGFEFDPVAGTKHTAAFALRRRMKVGRYHLIVSNRFSVFTGKRVQLNAFRAECVMPSSTAA